MTVGRVGKEILEEADFNKFRQALIEELVKKISRGGCYGADIRQIIEETLREEEFVNFANKLAKIIEKRTNISKGSANEAACQLVEEEIADDIKGILHGHLEEEKGKSKKEKEIDYMGRETKLWDEATKRFIGKKHGLKDIALILKEHRLMRITIVTGFILLIISAILFNSIYKAIVVGLTLTIFSGDSLRIKLANILGGLGGILIFFTSISILLQYALLEERRSMELKEMARDYLEKAKRKENFN